MDAMRRILSDIQSEERALLEQRTASMNAAKSLSLTILLVGGLIATVLAISVAFMLSRSIAGRLQQVVEVARNRELWRQSFSRGIPQGPVEKIGPAPNRRGTTVTFHADEQIFGHHRFKPARLLKIGRAHV